MDRSLCGTFGDVRGVPGGKNISVKSGDDAATGNAQVTGGQGGHSLLHNNGSSRCLAM